MLSGKQRAYLRSQAHHLEPLFQIGKGGVTPEATEAIDEALEAREMLKVSVLNNCAEDAKEIAVTLAGRTRSDVVQVIGRKFVLYRQSKKKPIIELPRK